MEVKNSYNALPTPSRSLQLLGLLSIALPLMYLPIL